MDDAGGEFASEVWQKNMRSTVHPLPRGAQDRKLQRCGPAIRLGRWILRSLSQPPNSHLDSAASMQNIFQLFNVEVYLGGWAAKLH